MKKLLLLLSLCLLFVGCNSSNDTYNIMKDFKNETKDDINYLYFNDFLLVMPASDDWEYQVSEENDAVTIYLKDGREDLYSGDIVTIKAFDKDDNSYEELPAYSVAGVGKNTNMRFVAIYPTDVTYNAQNTELAQKYHNLSTYLEKIGENTVNSPVTVE